MSTPTVDAFQSSQLALAHDAGEGSSQGLRLERKWVAQDRPKNDLPHPTLLDDADFNLISNEDHATRNTFGHFWNEAIKVTQSRREKERGDPEFYGVAEERKHVKQLNDLNEQIRAFNKKKGENTERGLLRFRPAQFPEPKKKQRKKNDSDGEEEPAQEKTDDEAEVEGDSDEAEVPLSEVEGDSDDEVDEDEEREDIKEREAYNKEGAAYMDKLPRYVEKAYRLCGEAGGHFERMMRNDHEGMEAIEKLNNSIRNGNVSNKVEPKGLYTIDIKTVQKMINLTMQYYKNIAHPPKGGRKGKKKMKTSQDYRDEYEGLRPKQRETLRVMGLPESWADVMMPPLPTQHQIEKSLPKGHNPRPEDYEEAAVELVVKAGQKARGTEPVNPEKATTASATSKDKAKAKQKDPRARSEGTAGKHATVSEDEMEVDDTEEVTVEGRADPKVDTDTGPSLHFTMDDLDAALEKEFNLPTGKVIAYRRMGAIGTQCILQSGSEKAYRYRLVSGTSARAADPNLNYNETDNLVEKDMRRGRDKRDTPQGSRVQYVWNRSDMKKIMGVAWKEDAPLGDLHPGSQSIPQTKKLFPATDVMILWKDNKTTWEPRGDVRRLYGNARRADAAIYYMATLLEKEYAKVHGTDQEANEEQSSGPPLRAPRQGSAKNAKTAKASGTGGAKKAKTSESGDRGGKGVPKDVQLERQDLEESLSLLGLNVDDIRKAYAN